MPDQPCTENPGPGEYVKVPRVGVVIVDRTEEAGVRLWGRAMATGAPVEDARRSPRGAWARASRNDMITAWLTERHASGEPMTLNVHGPLASATGVLVGKVVARVQDPDTRRTRVRVEDLNGAVWTGSHEPGGEGACRLRGRVMVCK